MASTVTKRRMGRIFRETGRTLIVAMDHAALFGNMPGLNHPGEALLQVREGGADAVLTTYGVSKRFSEEIGSMGLILRVDGGVSALAKQRGALQPVYGVRDALRLGADAAGCMGQPGSETEDQTLWYLSDVVSQCAEWDVPVMAEMLPGGFENPAEMWTSENIGHSCRIAAELGADFVKTAYSGDAQGFRQALSQVYIPVVVLGGSKSKEPRQLLQDISEALEAGASGVAVGRNIYQHPDRAAITAAVCAVIHDGVSVDTALGYME